MNIFAYYSFDNVFSVTSQMPAADSLQDYGSTWATELSNQCGETVSECLIHIS